jgi:hypothetical protein
MGRGANELACKPDTDAPSASNRPRGDVGRKGAYGVAPRWLRHPCPRYHHEQGSQDEGTEEDQSYAHDCMNTFRSLNPSDNPLRHR